MPNTVLQSFTKTGHKVKETTQTVNVTTNNLRLYHHTDGETYEFVGVNGNGERIYRNTKRIR